MPRRRPMDFLKRLGRRLRARRLVLNRTRGLVARGAEISTAQLSMYESGLGHPPAATLHRLAVVLGTTSSALLGETMADLANETFDTMARLYNDPFIGSVTRTMQEMTVAERKSLAVIATAMKNMPKPAERVEPMR
jgi:transcriptional regulator with XRE-family HTH domain